MVRPRLLIPLSIQFSVRYLLRTGLLGRIRDHADLIVLLGWEDAGLAQELAAAGAEVHPLPPALWSASYQRLRGEIDVWFKARLRSPSGPIDQRRGRIDMPAGSRLRKGLRAAATRARLLVPGRADALRERERRALRRETNLDLALGLIDSIRPDAVFCLTPFLRDEELIIRACEARGLPLCTAILSFDNVTTRGWLPAVFDRYLLWNRHNEAEVRRAYPEAAGRSLAVVGAPQFDVYRDAGYRWDEEEWRRRLGLPAGRPVILFGAGMPQIAPPEPHWLEQLDEAISRGEIPGDPIILLRRHPNDSPDRWREAAAQAHHVRIDDPWPVGTRHPGLTNVVRPDIERLASTLHHCSVHINASSTMTVDGAFFDRPQVGPAYDDREGGRHDRSMRELYRREHFLPITDSGGLKLALGRDELIDAVRRGLDDPAAGSAGRSRIVEEVCTYGDGLCTDRVDRAVRAFVEGAN